MRVFLTKHWFAPGAVRWRKGQYDNFPENLVPFLPSDTMIHVDGKAYTMEEYRKENPISEEELEELTKDYDTGTDKQYAVVDPGDENPESVNTSAGQGEFQGVASPKPSGPETTALPGVVAPGTLSTPSGSSPADKAAEQALHEVTPGQENVKAAEPAKDQPKPATKK
jgi:hypothetical protein